jgi:hypothetical protein
VSQKTGARTQVRPEAEQIQENESCTGVPFSHMYVFVEVSDDLDRSQQ